MSFTAGPTGRSIIDYGEGGIDIESFGDYAKDMLDRFDIPLHSVKDRKELKAAIEARWAHRHAPTDLQIDALAGAYEKRERLFPPPPPPPESRPEKLYTTTRAGTQIPRLASIGIKRITFETRYGRQTRYVIPGRKGLFGLESAREIFRSV